MGVSLCTVCHKCGSTLAEGPNSHYDPVPHEFKTKYDQNTGKPYEICINCMRTKEELEKEKIEDARSDTKETGEHLTTAQACQPETTPASTH
jgi:hypothetical protein